MTADEKLLARGKAAAERFAAEQPSSRNGASHANHYEDDIPPPYEPPDQPNGLGFSAVRLDAVQPEQVRGYGPAGSPWAR